MGISALFTRGPPTTWDDVGDITKMLQRVREGDGVAQNELMRSVYHELRELAAARLRGENDLRTLQPTALVHQAWLRLGGDEQPPWQNRRHFFGAASEAMRRIVVDHARRRQTERHGGKAVIVPIEEVAIASETPEANVVAVSDALEKLAKLSPDKAELVRLRYYVGLSLEETARALDISEATASRWWTYARAWLIQDLNSGPPNARS